MRDKYIGLAETKKDFDKLLERAQQEIEETERPVLDIRIESSLFRISLDNPTKQEDLKEWAEIKDKWEKEKLEDFKEFIRKKALSEIPRKIKSIKARIIESIESRKEGKEKPLEGKHPFGLLAIEQLRELEKNYQQQVDKKYSINRPYLFTKEVPYELKFMAFLAGYASFIERANLLEQKQENPILDLCNKHNIEVEVEKQLGEFWTLDRQSLDYKKWEEDLVKKFDEIIGKKKEQTQTLDQNQTLDEKLDQVVKKTPTVVGGKLKQLLKKNKTLDQNLNQADQNSNAQVFTTKFDTVGEILEGIKKREAATMLAKLNGELKSQSFSVDETGVNNHSIESQSSGFANNTSFSAAPTISQSSGFANNTSFSAAPTISQSSGFVNDTSFSAAPTISQSSGFANDTSFSKEVTINQSLSSLGELSNNSVEIQKEEKWGDLYNLEKATTKEDFAKLFEEAQKKANKNTEFIVEIGIGNDVYEIVLPSPISKTNHKKWTEILDKWEIGDLNLKEFIKGESISKIQEGLEVIENKIGTRSSSLKKEAHLSRILADLEETYIAGVDRKHILSSPLYEISEDSPFYIIGENAPSELKFMRLLENYGKLATLLGRTKSNPILEASRQYDLKNKLPEQVFRWSQLNRGSKKYKSNYKDWKKEYKDWKKESKEYRKKYKEWKKELSREVNKIFKLIKEKEIKEKQNLNSVNKSVGSNDKAKSQSLFSINKFFLRNIGNLFRFIKEDKKNSFTRNMLRALFHFITGNKKNSKGISITYLSPVPKEIGDNENISQIETTRTLGPNPTSKEIGDIGILSQVEETSRTLGSNPNSEKIESGENISQIETTPTVKSYKRLFETRRECTRYINRQTKLQRHKRKNTSTSKSI